MYNKRERVGRLRHQIRFMKPLVSRGTTGQEKRTWITSGPVWANIEYRLTGTDKKDVADRVQSFQSAVFTMRYAATVYPKMRIKADNQEFAIRAVMPDADRQYMTIQAIIDGPRQQTYTTPEGADWIDEFGQPWVYAFAGDVKTEGDEETTWTDSAGISYTGPDGPTFQDEDGNPLVTHEAGDVKTEATGLDTWTDDYGVTWNPA